MTTTYTFEQLKEDVRKEAEALRIHTTKEERERLNIELLDPHDPITCIYGLMSRKCDSDRAIELIHKCAPVMYKNTDAGLRPIGKPSNTDLIPYYNSPIEAYIQQPEANNANLIAYLRGETETLEL